MTNQKGMEKWWWSGTTATWSDWRTTAWWTRAASTRCTLSHTYSYFSNLFLLFKLVSTFQTCSYFSNLLPPTTRVNTRFTTFLFQRVARLGPRGSTWGDRLARSLVQPHWRGHRWHPWVSCPRHFHPQYHRLTCLSLTWRHLVGKWQFHGWTKATLQNILKVHNQILF